MVFGYRGQREGTFGNPDDIREATTGHRGLLSKADKATLVGLGTVLGNDRGSNLAVAAATVTTLASLTLTEGTWIVGGYAGILTGAAPGQVDVYLNALTGVSSWALAAATQAAGPTQLGRVLVAAGGSAVVDLKGYGNVAWTALANPGAAGFAGGTGLRAVRVG